MTFSLSNKQHIRKIGYAPKSLFLIDAIGALLTTSCMLFLLKPFQAYIGLPLHVLNILAGIAGIFSIYSFCCFFFLTSRWKGFLLIIGTANLLYCIFTGILLLIHSDSISVIGLIYFLLEMGIITVLAITEFKTGIRYDTTN